jgi:hypothetical protein
MIPELPEAQFFFNEPSTQLFPGRLWDSELRQSDWMASKSIRSSAQLFKLYSVNNKVI